MTRTAKTATLQVAVKRLPHAQGLALPAYQTVQSAGLDLQAAIADGAPVVIAPGAHVLVPTGLTFALPAGTEAQVRPRSGLAAKHGVTVLNSPGTIDADYRGEVSVLLINLGKTPFTLQRGDRIAQMIIAPVARAELVEIGRLDVTSRGAGGFGSTGVAGTKTRDTIKKRKSVAPKKVEAKPRTQKPRRGAKV